MRAEELYRGGVIEVGDAVLAAVDPETNTGVVIDSIVNAPLEEPTEPVPEPEPSVELPDGFELVSSEPRPTPGVVAPEGKVKLTVMTQPLELQGVMVYPPPGVYFINVYSVVTFTCVSSNPGWEFNTWTISRGALGLHRNVGLGYEHLFRWRVDVDTVVSAYNKELI